MTYLKYRLPIPDMLDWRLNQPLIYLKYPFTKGCSTGFCLTVLGIKVTLNFTSIKICLPATPFHFLGVATCALMLFWLIEQKNFHNQYLTLYFISLICVSSLFWKTKCEKKIIKFYTELTWGMFHYYDMIDSDFDKMQILSRYIGFASQKYVILFYGSDDNWIDTNEDTHRRSLLIVLLNACVYNDNDKIIQ